MLVIFPRGKSGWGFKSKPTDEDLLLVMKKSLRGRMGSLITSGAFAAAFRDSSVACGASGRVGMV
jgi:hypothetical protein